MWRFQLSGAVTGIRNLAIGIQQPSNRCSRGCCARLFFFALGQNGRLTTSFALKSKQSGRTIILTSTRRCQAGRAIPVAAFLPVGSYPKGFWSRRRKTDKFALRLWRSASSGSAISESKMFVPSPATPKSGMSSARTSTNFFGPLLRYKSQRTGLPARFQGSRRWLLAVTVRLSKAAHALWVTALISSERWKSDMGCSLNMPGSIASSLKKEFENRWFVSTRCISEYRDQLWNLFRVCTQRDPRANHT